MTHNLSDYFKGHELTQGFSDHELRDFVTLFSVQKFEAGATIIAEGSNNSAFFIILTGIADVFKCEEGTDNLFKINEMKGGALFGEMSVLTDEPISASIHAQTDCEILTLTHEHALSHPAYIKLLLNATKIVIQRLKRISGEQARIMSEKMREQAEREKLEAELQAAHDVQVSFLPKENPSIPGFQICGYSDPAKEVGGDLYDFAPVNDQVLAVTLGDVSGKGMPAALFMVECRSVIRSYAMYRGEVSASEIIGQSNLRLCEDSENGMFVTVFFVLLDHVNSKLTYANAGHNPPMFFQHKSKEISELPPGGIVLGVFDDFQFEQAELLMEPNDILVVFSDGITEAHDPDKELYEEDRLMEVIKTNAAKSAEEIQQAILDSVYEFMNGAKQFDDMTIVVIKKVSVEN